MSLAPIKKTQHQYLAMVSLFFLIFIDSMGLGLLFPILNEAILDPSVTFFTKNTTMTTRLHWYGFTVSIFMFAWFFGAALLGDASDAIGRKKALTICLLGGFLGYLLSAVGITLHSLWLLILGRIIAGLTAGSQSVAQAAIIDLSTEDNKARYIAYIILAGCIGFAFGPIIGAVLVNSNIVTWFDITTPLYIAALLSIFNAVLLLIGYQDKDTNYQPLNLRWQHAIEVFVSAFRHADLKKLSILLFGFIFAWNSFFSYISFFILSTYQFSVSMVSLFIACLGIGFSLVSGYFVGLLEQRVLLRKSTSISLILGSLFITMIITIKYQWCAWISVFLIGVTLAIAYSNIITLFSKQVADDCQGWVMGISGAIMALASASSIFLLSNFVTLGASVPLIVAALGMILVAGFMYRIKLTVE